MRDAKPQAEWTQSENRNESYATERRVYEAVKSAMSFNGATTDEQDHMIALACQDVARRMLAILDTTETED